MLLRVTSLVIIFATAGCQRAPYQEGGRLYAVHCANCHGDEGQGLGGLIPPVAGSDYLQNHRENLACILVNGLSDTITVNGKAYFGQPMPPNNLLNDIQVTNILNFINNNWENKNGEFSLEQVRSILSRCKE